MEEMQTRKVMVDGKVVTVSIKPRVVVKKAKSAPAPVPKSPAT